MDQVKCPSTFGYKEITQKVCPGITERLVKPLRTNSKNVQALNTELFKNLQIINVSGV